MELMKAFAIALQEDKDFNGVWPEPATEFTQHSTYGGEFDQAVSCTSWSGQPCTSAEYEFSNGPFMEEYEDGETITKEEYLAFTADSQWYSKMMAERPALIAKIAELNKEIGAKVDEITALADEAGIDFTINLGQHGGVDPNSDWDSSRC